MSTLLKKPFIEEVVDGLDDQTISSFQKFLDMGEGYSVTYSLRGGELPAGANPSVERCTLLIDGPAQLCGVYVKYKKGNENRSAMISFTTLESCTMYEIDEDRLTCRRVRERLSASELRRVLRERDIAKTENGSVIYNDGIEVKNNGDVAIGKNLEVDGTTKLNGGLTPIATYEADITNQNTSTHVVLYDYGEIGSTKDNTKQHLLAFSDSMYVYYGIGFYLLSGQKLYAVRMSGYNSASQFLCDISATVPNQISVTRYASQTTVNLKQDRLYIHTLTLTASDKTYILVYDSSSNLNADSVADLRTIMKISSTHESEVLPLCSSDMTSTACLKVTTSICQIGTNNVTAVADDVDLK